MNFSERVKASTLNVSDVFSFDEGDYGLKWRVILKDNEAKELIVKTTHGNSHYVVLRFNETVYVKPKTKTVWKNVYVVNNKPIFGFDEFYSYEEARNFSKNCLKTISVEIPNE